MCFNIITTKLERDSFITTNLNACNIILAARYNFSHKKYDVKTFYFYHNNHENLSLFLKNSISLFLKNSISI